jgi:predicted aminopeptidase
MAISGCYLGHLAAGQARLMQARRPIAAVVDDPATPADLRHQLETVERARAFAQTLGLEVADQYTSYVAWPGDRVITTVVATRPGETEPAGFWFPFLGRLPYKGFFDRARAEAFGEELAADDLDVCVVGVSAYSTLGWMADPVTAPMLRGGEGRTVETIFHELVHATVYEKDHIDFNETVASFIGQEASVRFYASAAGESEATTRRESVEDSRTLTAALVDLRDRVAALYEDTQPGPAQHQQRTTLESATRREISRLTLASRDSAELAETIRLNDACLALSGTYGADTPRYVERLAELGGDLPAFIARLRETRGSPDPAAALLGR